MPQQLTSAQVIAELAALAGEVSADELMEGGQDTLAEIARALVKDIQRNLSVDWLGGLSDGGPRPSTRL